MTSLNEVKSQPTPIYRNNETLTQLNKDHLPPFNLLIKPKPILQTHPHSPIHFQEFPKDDEEVRLTRPRVYKAPEISLDDIEDPEIRQQIIQYTYATTSNLASKETGVKSTKFLNPDFTWEPPDHVLFAREERVKDSICGIMTGDDLNKWHKLQSRVLRDATIWNNFKANKQLTILDQAIIIDEKSTKLTEEILSLAKANRLRFPFTIKPIGYAGFMPGNPLGIKPEKCQLESSDSMLTSYQISNRWRDGCH